MLNLSDADVPFFLVCFDPNSLATVKHIKDWETCQSDGNKVCLWLLKLFGMLNGILLLEIALCGMFNWCVFLKATIFAIGSCCSVFMTHVIFQIILVGLFATFLHLFLWDGISSQFASCAIERIMVSQIWSCPLLVKPWLQFHKVERQKLGNSSFLIDSYSPSFCSLNLFCLPDLYNLLLVMV